MKGRYLVMSQVQLTKSHQSLKEENIGLIIKEVARRDLDYFVWSLLDPGWTRYRDKEKCLTSTIKTENTHQGPGQGCTPRTSGELTISL